jgi:hypothetical protein
VIVGGEPLSPGERLPQATPASRGLGLKAPPHVVGMTGCILQGVKNTGRPRAKVWTGGLGEGSQSHEGEGHK